MPDASSQQGADAARIEALCRTAAAGGPHADEAVEELLFLHHNRVLGFARRKVGVDFAGKLDAEDILQEAFTEVFRTIGHFEHRGEDAFYRWVTRIIEQRFIDAVRGLRRQKRDVTRERALNAPAISDSRHWTLCRLLSAGERTPSQAVARTDAIAAMMLCMARLGEDDRYVIDHIHLRGQHPAEVGKVMGRSEDAVRRLAGRAMERLAALMGRASRYLSRS